MVTSRSIASATFRNLYRILVLRRAIRNARCRRVLSFVGSTNVLAILATIGLRAMVVVSERNDPSRQSLGFFWDRLRRLTYRCATVVTANSGHALKAMKGFVPGHKLQYVPNAVSGRLQPQVERKPIVLAVGRMVAQKAWDVLIDGFALVAGELPQWRLVFVGRGELEPLLRERAKARGIEARVDWAGLVADVGPYYADASIFALPSRYEGTSNALLEAMAAGVPVIVSAAVNPDADIVSNGASGIVIPTGDTSAMSAAIRVLATNPALRARLAEAARVTVDRFSPESVRETWESVLGLTPATAAADLRRSP
jgi:glycosyltransferase involved in cell wall biosynthesis